MDSAHLVEDGPEGTSEYFINDYAEFLLDRPVENMDDMTYPCFLYQEDEEMPPITLFDTAAITDEYNIPPLLPSTEPSVKRRKTTVKAKKNVTVAVVSSTGPLGSSSSERCKTIASSCCAIERTPVNKSVPAEQRYTDKDVVGFAVQLHGAFNTGDIECIDDLIDHYCVENFVFRCSFSETDLVGRDSYKRLFSALLQDHPDRYHFLNYSKIVNDSKTGDRFLAVKVSYEGTKCSYTRDELNHLVDSHHPDVLRALGANGTIALRMQTFEHHKIPFVYTGTTWMRYTLTPENKLSDVMLTRKLTSCEDIITAYSSAIYMALASEFPRLYRQLAKGKEHDLSFEKERRRVFHELGYDVGEIHRRKRLELNKHHGKGARENEYDVQQKGRTTNHSDFYRRRKQLQDQMTEVDRLSEVAKEVKLALLESGTVPTRLLEKALGKSRLESLPKPSSSSNKSSKSQSSPIHKYKKPLVRSLPPIDRNESDERAGMKKRALIATKQTWSKEERDHLNDLYWDIPRPINSKAAVWDVYYSAFVSRFLQKYPQRDPADVKSKIESMVINRQMKERGEKEYWERQSGKRETAAAPPTSSVS